MAETETPEKLEASLDGDEWAEESDPRFRVVVARKGDSISKLLGSSHPAAIGRFLSLNGMDGRSSTIRVGQSYAVPTEFDPGSNDERRAGDHLLRKDNTRLERLRAAREKQQLYRLWGLLNTTLNPQSGELVRTSPRSERPTIPKAKTSWIDSYLAKSLAGQAGDVLGGGYGIGRGAVHTVQGAVDAGKFGLRLLNPFDATSSRPGEAAWDELFGGGKHVLDYLGSRATDPNLVRTDLMKGWRDANVALNPSATPTASTSVGEFRRRFGVGANQGELAFNIAGLAFGTPELATLRAVGLAPKIDHIATYMAQGFARKEAERLAESYDGWGQHVIARSAKLPKYLGGGPVPKSIVESPFNILKPFGMTKGEFYPRHFQVDDRMYGAPIFRGQRGWSGKRLGLRKHELPLRVWDSRPDALKALVAGGTTAGILDQEISQ